MRSAPGATTGGTVVGQLPRPSEILTFDWKEVGCFLRPQMILCDRATPGGGLAFLFWCSLYRTFGLNDFFVDPAKQHFPFVRAVGPSRMGLYFETTAVEQRSEILETLKKVLSSGEPAIIPVGIRLLPYYRFFRQQDQRHYLIVTGIDQDCQSFLVHDNLHVRPDNEDTEFRDTTLPGRILEDIAGRYFEHDVGSPEVKDQGVTSFWLLRIRRASGCPQRTEQEMLYSLLEECRRFMAGPQADPASPAFLDPRWLDRIRHAYDQGDFVDLTAQSRGYLVDCNFAVVHWKVIAYAIASIDISSGQQARNEIEVYRHKAGVLRSKLLARSLAARRMTAQEWAHVRSELMVLADGVMRHFRSFMEGI